MSFALQIGRWSQKTMAKQDTVRRAVILKLFSAIIKDTPVLTGRLRGSWQCSIGHPDLTVLPPKGNHSGAAPVAKVVDAAQASKPTDTVILSNALPYVARIEYEGWSHTKAPAGMVRKNVARFRQLLSSEIHKLT